MSGIHIHPHDLMDEGASAVLNLVELMRDVIYLFPEMNTIFERNPYPTGILPHNPVRSYVLGTGTFHVNVDFQALSPSLSQVMDPAVAKGQDPLRDLLNAVQGTAYKVVPWVNLLNGHFEGDLVQNTVVDFRGRQSENWLCPNGRDVVQMWTKVLAATTEKYGTTTYLLDRIRYPDWAGKKVNPSGIFSCFCSRCQEKMNEQGLNPIAQKIEMGEIARMLFNREYDSAVIRLKTSDTLQAWFQFKQNNVSSFIERLVTSLREHNPSIKCWLDLWPPSYAWMLGQDYRRLTHSSTALKHFPYHKLGGGADVQGLIQYFAHSGEEQEQAFQAFLQLFDLPYSLTYEKFKKAGFPIAFVGNENRKARLMSRPDTRIFSGIQMWNLSTEELVRTIEEARASDADDLLYYCYGWAERELFEAVGIHNELI